ncbi:septum formation initiator family protein [Flavobacterium chungangensis]|uniref:Septum formation initiator family protein n=1 Tax=Flavobacterium chungangensis TaxID=2708132 RepID=A0ABV8ZBJ3_9FLAO
MNENLPIYDLIFEENRTEGVYGVSLVADPAISDENYNVEFVKFSKEIIECNCSKEEEDFSSERIDQLIQLGEEITDEWELLDEKKVENEDDVLNIDFAYAVPTSEGGSVEDNEIFKVRYKYSPSSTSSNSREFCRKMVASNKVFKYDDLVWSDSNPGFGKKGASSYNVLFYKGGVNCKHFFTRQIFFNKGNKEGVTTFEALKRIGNLNKEDQKKAKLTPLDPKVSQTANASNNYWRLSTEEMNFSTNDKEKRIITAPVLIPNQLIYRNFEGGCYVRASAETIENLQIHFFKNKYQSNSTIEHDDDKKIEDITFFESWTIADEKNDKAVALGFKNLPKGTLMMSAKLSESTWNEYIKTGKVKGFSIDSKLGIAKNKKEKMNYSSVKEQIMKKILLESDLKEFKISDDLSVKAGSLEKDQVVFDANDAPLVSATFVYEGKSYSTDENGVIIDIQEVKQEEVEQADEAGDLKAENDELKAENENLKAEIEKLKADLDAVKEEAVNLAKESKAKTIQTKITKEDIEKMTPLEKYRYQKNL